LSSSSLSHRRSESLLALSSSLLIIMTCGDGFGGGLHPYVVTCGRRSGL
jgi:hypothetical protein